MAQSGDSSAETLRKSGSILVVLPNSMLRVRMDDGTQVIGTPTRSAVQKWTKFLPGDRVVLAISPFDPTRGRIEARE